MSKIREAVFVAAVSALVTVMATAAVQNIPPSVPLRAQAYTTDIPSPEPAAACEESGPCSPERLYSDLIAGLNLQFGGSIVELRVENKSSTRVSGAQFRAPNAFIAVSCGGRLLCDNARAVRADHNTIEVGAIEPGQYARLVVVLDQRAIDERSYSLAMPDGRAVRIDYLNDDGYPSLGILGMVRRNLPISELVVMIGALFALFLVAGVLFAMSTANNFPLMTKLNSRADLERIVKFANYLRTARPELAARGRPDAPSTEDEA
jgi:hypothetical protein